MAKDTYVQFSYTVLDELGTKASFFIPVFVDGAILTPVTMSTQWTNLGNELDGVTAGQILGGAITIVKNPAGGWKDAPLAGSRVEQTANFNFANAVTKYKFGINIPALDNANIEADKSIDLTATDVANFVAAIIAGFTNGSYVTTGLQVLTGLADAFISFRKHRKQLNRSSYEVPPDV